ncbi:putative F-box/kelch-repeat protein At3g17570 [Silene latifolia]|uniref:putative F-box/kelch-repeat protein At3g17570 n=1 Tax=Silene latifolia TaxID=37657 RepID=UPI003D7849EC
MESMETTILPDDVLEEILVRLPVKYLVGWKCVCKHWYALIGDYDFAKKHYHFQYAMHRADKDAGPLFLDSPSTAHFYLLSKDGGDDVVLDMTADLERDIPPTFGNDSELRNSSARCIGVINGVIGLLWDRTRLALWNPATREFKDVARWPVIPDNKAAEQFGGEIHGFVFDQQSNDFKILGLINFDGGDDVSTVYEFHLYSLKSNSWKRIKKGPSCRLSVLFSVKDAYLSNGVYYWRTYKDIWSFENPILSFDFNTEIFKEFEPPKGSGCRSNQHTRIINGQVLCDCKYQQIIGKYKEGIALFVTRTLENLDCSFEIWAVTKFREDDHGVPLSWELVVTVDPIHSFTWSLTVKAFRAYGDLLVMVRRGNYGEDQEACLYDPSTHTFNNLGIAFASCYKYVESLFSVSG